MTLNLKIEIRPEYYSKIPLSRILTESEGPFIEDQGIPITPTAVSSVISYMAGISNSHYEAIESMIDRNFKSLIISLK